MSYIDDVLGGVISEGETLVRGYVNDALDPVGDLIIDAMQAIGLLDSLESEWQKFERDEMSKYKGGFSPEDLKSRYQDVLDDIATGGQDISNKEPHVDSPYREKNTEAHRVFKTNEIDLRPLDSDRDPLNKAKLFHKNLDNPGSLETVNKQRRSMSEVVSRSLKGMTHESRKFLENLNADNLLAGRAESYRHNHKLELMGKLDFAYPISAFKEKDPTESGHYETIRKDGETFNVFSLPFFENPKISESRSATYTNNIIINRNEPYKVWMGAKGKQVNIDFNISMTHLMTFAAQQFNELTTKSVHEDGMRELVLEGIRRQNDKRTDVTIEDFDPTQGNEISTGQASADTAPDMYSDTNNILNNPSTHVQGLSDSQSFRAKVIVYTVYLLDMIRTSVIGSTKWPETPTHGKKLTHPPITFLSFGALYDEEPFIVKSYDLNFDGKNGYEELSLLPRTITVKLKLESYDQLKESQVVQGLSKRYYLNS